MIIDCDLCHGAELFLTYNFPCTTATSALVHIIIKCRSSL